MDSPFATGYSERDRDWILAIGQALGLDSGFRVPIVPDVEPFKQLFADVRKAALVEAQAMRKAVHDYFGAQVPPFLANFMRERIDAIRALAQHEQAAAAVGSQS